MDIETITKLVDAGYTKAEILAMSAEQSKENEGAGNEGAGNEGAGNEGAKDEGAGNESAQNVNTDAAIKALTETVNALTNTVKAMQETNVKNASGGKPDKMGVEETMKSFIDSL